MTKEERLRKIKQAEDLIREVEFSYQPGDWQRTLLYKVVVDTFSCSGSLDLLRMSLKQQKDSDASLD